MPSKKTTNYLQFILIIFSVIFIATGMLSAFSKDNENSYSNKVNSAIDDLDLSPELISNNLITYIKKSILISPTKSINSPLRGNPNAPVTIFEFSCYGCPASKSMQPILNQLLELYPDQINIVWKDLPISDLYPTAELAHVAARCASEQGAYWEYHDKLWENQNDFSLNNLKNIAKQIDIDEERLEQCINNKETINLIESDISEAAQLSIPGTPHFYINNQEISGSIELEDFKNIIEIELNR